MTDWTTILTFLEWSPTDTGYLEAIDWAGLIDTLVPAVYDRVRTIRELDDKIRQHSSYDRLSRTLADYVRGLAEDPTGAAYLARLRRLGEVHARIGLRPEWYLGAYRIFWQQAAEAIERKWPEPTAERERARTAVFKPLTADMIMAIGVYSEAL